VQHQYLLEKHGGGTVLYNTGTGGQTVMAGTYNNLTLSNTSSTQTASGNLIVNSTLITTAGGTLNMGTNTLTVTTPSNAGIIQTQNTSSTPITTGKSWGGTVQYNATTGAQAVMSGTYNNLTLSNTSGTQTASGNLNVLGIFLTTMGGTLNLVTSQLTIGASATITNGGTIQTQNTTTTPISSSKTWGGTVQYNATSGGQTINYGVYTNLTLSNTSGAQTATGTLTVNGILTTTAGGTLNMAAYQLLGTPSTIVNGGTIETQNTGATPLPTGETWGGNVLYDATATQPVIAGTYNNLTLAGSGTKTFANTTTTNGNFTINTGVIANLGTFSHTANTLTLGGNGQAFGIWGGTAATTATFHNATYFGTTATGTVNVQSASCAAGSWTGNISTDWNTSANWCDGVVPTASTNVIINSGGNQPVIGSAAVCNSLTINSGATLTVSGVNTLTISSNWTNNGTFTPGTGTVIMNGAAQTINGTASTTFYHLSLTGTASVTTGADVTIGGNLNIGNGTTFTTGAYNLTITGTTTVGGGASGTLAISSATGAKTFTGAVTINSGGILSESVAEDLIFGSDVTITGTLNEYGTASVSIAGKLTNNGTYTASTGIHTFSGATKTISGSSATSIPNVAVTGTYTNTGTLTIGTVLSGVGTLTNGTLTNAGTLNIGGTCSVTTLANNYGITTVTGSGAITTGNITNTGTLNLNGSGAITGITNNAAGIVNLANSGNIASFNNATATSTLNISDLTPPTITTLNVSALGNMVNYNGAGNQTVKDVSYSNINFSGSGTKTYQVGGARTANILTVATGITLLLNGNNSLTPASATINGAVTVQNSASLVKGSGTISFTSGSFFNDGVDGGIIPTATWDLNSTCNITGYVNNPNSSNGLLSAFQTSINQAFGNFTWSSTSQKSLGASEPYSLAGQLVTVNGNLAINSTGLGTLTLGNNVTGDLTVGGDFIQTGGDFIVSGAGARTMTVVGNFSLSNSSTTFDLSSSGTAGNFTTVNVGGNFSFTEGTITESGSTTASIINFNGATGTQTFTSGGTLSNAVNFAILSGASVDFGTSVLSSGSTGGFTLYPGGTLITASTAGITTSGTSGSIQLRGTRAYNAGANYVYDGTGAQVTGNGLVNPASVTISNSAGVTFSAATAMNYLTITNGAKANLGTFGHTASALSLNGDGYSTGTWGGTGSGATNIDPVYFAATSGIVTLTNSAGQTFSTSTTVTIPCGVTSITVEAWGGGGAGSSLTTGTNGAGGGGGAYSKGTVAVTPGSTYIVTVGAGATPSTSSTTSTPGGDSWFGSTTTILAKGGSSVKQNSNTTGGAGGVASACIGTTTFSGGTGAVGTGSAAFGYGGGGGSSAGSAATGVNGVANVNTGGTAPAGGGNGGNGGASATPPGVTGSIPGGGGGGAHLNGGSSASGGNGANGQVIITYINVIPTITLGSNPTVCQGSTTANLPYSTITGCPDKYSIVYNAAAQAAGFVNVSYATLPSSPIQLSVPAGAAAGTYQGNLSLVNSSTGSPSSKYPITVTLNPTAAITSMTTTTCSKTAFTVTPVNITNGTVPSGTTYSWSTPAVTGGMTGGASGSGVTYISGTLTNPTNTTQTATYTVIPLSGTCSGNAFTVTVTVNPTPALTALTAIACSGGAFTVTPVNTTNGIVPDGTTYSWTAPVVTGGMTGGTSGSGSLSINGTLTNPTNTVQTATYTVTPLSGSCSGSSTFTLTVTVYPTPAITAMSITAVSGGTFTITPVNGTNGLVPSGTTYNWSAPSGTGFTGGAASSSTPTSITGNLTLTGSSATATYTVTPTFVSCSGNPFTVTVTITPNLWLGTSSSSDWGVGTNWAAGIPPLDGADVVFANTPNNDLVLDGDKIIGNLTNTSSKRLFIPAGKSLTINGTINTNNDPAKIYVQSSSTLANGSLIFTTSSPVYGTVEMYARGSWNSTGSTYNGKTYHYSWQYFGIPVTNITASPTFDGSFVRSWNESGTTIDNHWVSLNNSSQLQPGIGYELTQKNPVIIVFQGQLINWDMPFTNLPYTTSTPPALFPGQSILANPFTSAIYINQIAFGTNMMPEVYFYTTGSIADWSSGNQYIVSTPGTAGNTGVPAQIPSMQAVVVQATANAAAITFPYAAIVKNTDLLRSKKSINVSDSTLTSTRIDVTGTNYSDKMWLFSQSGCTRKFDNGWDGVKIMGDAVTPQIFAIETDNNYQIDAVADINNTILGFQAGGDTKYTLTFTHQNTANRYAGIYLLDLLEDKTVDIAASGSTYSFTAETTARPVKRFMIATRPIDDATEAATQLKVFNSGNTVFIQNGSNQSGNMVVYDMLGHALREATFGPYGVTAIQIGTVPGVYIAKAATAGEKVSKKIIIGD